MIEFSISYKEKNHHFILLKMHPITDSTNLIFWFVFYQEKMNKQKGNKY